MFNADLELQRFTKDFNISDVDRVNSALLYLENLLQVDVNSGGGLNIDRSEMIAALVAKNVITSSLYGNIDSLPLWFQALIV